MHDASIHNGLGAIGTAEGSRGWSALPALRVAVLKDCRPGAILRKVDSNTGKVTTIEAYGVQIVWRDGDKPYTMCIQSKDVIAGKVFLVRDEKEPTMKTPAHQNWKRS